MCKINVGKYWKECIALFLQLLLFYVYPIFTLKIDPMGAVLIMLFVTFLISTVLGIFTQNRINHYSLIV